jgi:hypothetical protein
MRFYTYYPVNLVKFSNNVVGYILHCWGIDPPAIIKIATKHFDRRTVMTAAEHLEIRGMQQGMRAGIQQEMQERAADIACKMLRAGESMVKIRQYTGLSQREIQQLKK